VALLEKLGPLGERQFRLLWWGQSASAFGDSVVLAALPFAVLDLTGSAADLGLVFTAYTLPYIAFVLAGGVWSDRLPRQLVMVASDAVRALVQALIAVLLLSGSGQLWHLVVLTVVYASAAAFFQPAVTGLVPQTIDAERLQQANALLGATREAVFAAGLALSGLIVAATNPGTAYAVDAATFIVSAGFLVRIHVLVSVGTRQPFLAEFVAGWRAVAARTWLWVTLAWSGAFVFAVVAPVQVLGPIVARESLGGPAAWGAIAGAFSAGALAGGALAYRWRPVRPLRAAACLNFLAAAGPALLAARASVAAIVPAQFASGVAGGFFTAVWATTLQERIEPEMISRVGSLSWLGSSVAAATGYAVTGSAAATVGIAETLAFAAAWVFISTGGALLVRSIRHLERKLPA
jgi:MFS family permease